MSAMRKERMQNLGLRFLNGPKWKRPRLSPPVQRKLGSTVLLFAFLFRSFLGKKLFEKPCSSSHSLWDSFRDTDRDLLWAHLSMWVLHGYPEWPACSLVHLRSNLCQARIIQFKASPFHCRFSVFRVRMEFACHGEGTEMEQPRSPSFMHPWS